MSTFFLIRGINTSPLEESLYYMNKLQLKEAMNTSYDKKFTNQGLRATSNTPFRLATNAGDPLSRKHYSCGGTSAQGNRPSVYGIKRLYGNIKNNCDNTGIEGTNCNVKYVYDSSDYIRYKRIMAKH